MPTIIYTLCKEDPRSHETIRDLCIGIFLDGECYAFATALSVGLGWPMIGLMDGKVIRHVVVQDHDGNLHDARGLIKEEEFGLGGPFGLKPPYDLRKVSASDLVRDGESSEVRANTVRRARMMAETIWPELPWRNSFAARATAFADELETLSKKHGLWIRSPVPAAAPLLAISHDDEDGYTLRPTIDGITFTIDRRLT